MIHITLVFSLTLVLFNMGCATKKIKINTTEKSTVSLVDPKNLADSGQVIGPVPAEIEVNKIQGRIIKIAADGKLPGYLVVTDVLGVETNAFMTLIDSPEEKPPEKKDDQNLIFRFLLNSYQSLTQRKFDEALKLGEKAEELSKEIAAPHIIKGLAYMGLGNRAQAMTSFRQAKTLDPGDTEIDKLIKAVE
jgi:tetratricopeptide (TPR) repeat protein